VCLLIDSRAHRSRAVLQLALVAFLGAGAGCRSAWAEPDLLGRSSDEVVERLGSPDWTAELRIHRGVRLLEYRGGLHRFAPSGPGSSAEVKECGWKRWFGTTVIWLMRSGSGDWRVVDSLSWRSDVRF